MLRHSTEKMKQHKHDLQEKLTENNTCGHDVGSYICDTVM